MALRHGAGKLFEKITAYENDALDDLDKAEKNLRFNPDLAKRKIESARDAIYKARQVRNEELAALVQKAAPSLELKFDDHEARLREIEALLSGLRLELPERIPTD